jgi:hypothetical protein
MDKIFEAFSEGLDTGWESALSMYGLRDCTIRNSGTEIIRVPIGRLEAYIELDLGEEVSLKTVA